MNKTLFLAALVGFVLLVPGVTHAAFNFQGVSSDQIYFEQEQNAIIVNETRTSPAYNISPPAGVTCESEAQQAGLSEGTNYWCIQKAVIGSLALGNCVFLCQIGEGSGSIPSGPTTGGKMITYILSSPPVGHPLSYFNNASVSEQNAMYDAMMCLAMPAYGTGCTLMKHTPTAAVPTVTLTANPSSITRGASSALTWSSVGATSCTGTGFSTGNATSGTVSVSPTATTAYSVTCTGPGGSASDQETITVTQASALSGSCSASPSIATTGQAVAWSASTTGGVAPYTITWSGENLSGTGTSKSVSYSTAGTKSGSVTITDAASGSVTIACSNSVAVSDTNSSVPDLTAGTVSPTAATRHQAVTLSATVSNNGGGAAPASTASIWIRNPAGATIRSANMTTAGIAAGGSTSVSYSYTFTIIGTYSVRVCADANTSWAGTVTETDESNNCGAWTDVTVTTVAPSGTVSCNVSPTSVAVGGSVTYTATPSGGASAPYSWDGADGAGYGSASTVTRTLSTGGTYSMSVSASGASTPAQCPLVTAAANWCTTTTPDLTITASPNRVRTGQTSTITWAATGVTGQNATCTVSGPGVSWSSPVSAAPVCSAGSSAAATISTQSTYTLTCGSSVKTVTVNVIPNFTEF